MCPQPTVPTLDKLSPDDPNNIKYLFPAHSSDTTLELGRAVGIHSLIVDGQSKSHLCSISIRISISSPSSTSYYPYYGKTPMSTQ